MMVGKSAADDGYIATRWETLNQKKSTLARYWEKYASWTLPAIYPQEGTTETEELQYDFQSVGAEAVNTLASKLGLAFFPPNRPFFKLQTTPKIDAATEDANLSSTEVDAVFANHERKAMRRGEAKGVRPALINGSKSLLITGNNLLHYPPDDDTLRSMAPTKFCVRRDGSGKWIEIVIKEKASLMDFEQDVQDLIRIKRNALSDVPHDEHEVIYYTYIRRTGKGMYELWHAADQYTIPNSKVTYNDATFPYNLQTWTLIDGEDYGRSLVQDYAGDFHANSGVSEARAGLIAIVANIQFFVDPQGGVDISAVNKSDAGTYHAGGAGAISASTQGIQAHYPIVTEAISEYTRRIGRAFLVNSSMVRDAERVTEAEINFIEADLTANHGGAYSTLSADTQQWLARMLMRDIDRDKLLGLSDIVVTTGIDALARSADNIAIQQWIGSLVPIAQVPEGLQARLKLDKLAKKLASGFGVDDTEYYKSEQEIAAEQQQQAALQAKTAVASNIDPNQQQEQ